MMIVPTFLVCKNIKDNAQLQSNLEETTKQVQKVEKQLSVEEHLGKLSSKVKDCRRSLDAIVSHCKKI